MTGFNAHVLAWLKERKPGAAQVTQVNPKKTHYHCDTYDMIDPAGVTIWYVTGDGNRDWFDAEEDDFLSLWHWVADR